MLELWIYWLKFVYLAYILPADLQETYSIFKGEFYDLLKYAVNQIFKEKAKFLNDMKLYLICESPKDEESIKLISDEFALIGYLKKYCFVSNFGLLIAFAKSLEMTSITEKIEEFKQKRNELYKKILARDFAQRAIKDHEKMPDCHKEVRYFVNCNIFTPFYIR